MDHSKLKLPSGYLTMEVTHVFQGSFHGETSETSFLLASPWYLTVANMFGHIKKSLPEKDCIHWNETKKKRVSPKDNKVFKQKKRTFQRVIMLEH